MGSRRKVLLHKWATTLPLHQLENGNFASEYRIKFQFAWPEETAGLSVVGLHQGCEKNQEGNCFFTNPFAYVYMCMCISHVYICHVYITNRKIYSCSLHPLLWDPWDCLLHDRLWAIQFNTVSFQVLLQFLPTQFSDTIQFNIIHDFGQCTLRLWQWLTGSRID